MVSQTSTVAVSGKTTSATSENLKISSLEFCDVIYIVHRILFKAQFLAARFSTPVILTSRQVSKAMKR